MFEGSISTISARVGNEGTSLALSVQSNLVCEGVTVTNPVVDHGMMPADTSTYVQWEVESEQLDWWSQSTDVSCEIQHGTNWNNTPLESKSEQETLP